MCVPHHQKEAIPEPSRQQASVLPFKYPQQYTNQDLDTLDTSLVCSAWAGYEQICSVKCARLSRGISALGNVNDADDADVGLGPKRAISGSVFCITR